MRACVRACVHELVCLFESGSTIKRTRWFGLTLNTTFVPPKTRYGVKCGGDLDMWESSGWISTIDPYGWFQCTCSIFFLFDSMWLASI